MTARKPPVDFGSAASARRRRPPVSEVERRVGAGGAVPGVGGGVARKYTVLLDDQVADAFDERLLAIRRQLGRKIDKSQVIRQLLTLLDEDPTLVAQVVDRLKLR